jgi:hypothetical protein
MFSGGKLQSEGMARARDIFWTKEGGDDGPGDTDDPTDGDHVLPEYTDLRRKSSDLLMPLRTLPRSHYRSTGRGAL